MAMTLRMAHRIAIERNPFIITADNDTRSVREFNDSYRSLARSAFSCSAVVIADEIATNPDDHQNLITLPACVPPASDTFVEWNLPAGRKSFLQCGILAHSFDLRLREQGAPEAVRWNIALTMFLTTISGRVVLLEDAGRVQLNHNGIPVQYRKPGDGFESAGLYEAEEFVAHAVITVLRTFAMCKCSNVELTECSEASPTPKWLRRTKSPSITYKTLIVRIGRSVRRLGVLPVGYQRDAASHMCRGHFRTYGEDSPGLFGKYHGTFWCPQHIRGNKKNGVVVKDYRVKAPRES